MASGPSLPPRPRHPWQRVWRSYEDFQVTQLNQLERLLREGIAIRDTISFLETADATGELVAVTLLGRVFCADDVVVRIHTRMRARRGLRNRYEVAAVGYQYHAWVRGRPGRSRRDIIRYDTNQHRPQLHVHLYDPHGFEIEVREVVVEELPTLEDFVRHAVKVAG